MDVKKVILNWDRTQYDKIHEKEDSDFYAFAENGELVYIGIAYRQDVKKEIDNTINKFNYNKDYLIIWLGFIETQHYERISEELVKDIECALIYVNQPRDNTQCKKSYTGRSNLKIESRGCHHIISIIIQNKEE